MTDKNLTITDWLHGSIGNTERDDRPAMGNLDLYYTSSAVPVEEGGKRQPLITVNADGGMLEDLILTPRETSDENVSIAVGLVSYDPEIWRELSEAAREIADAIDAAEGGSDR